MKGSIPKVGYLLCGETLLLASRGILKVEELKDSDSVLWLDLERNKAVFRKINNYPINIGENISVRITTDVNEIIIPEQMKLYTISGKKKASQITKGDLLDVFNKPQTFDKLRNIYNSLKIQSINVGSRKIRITENFAYLLGTQVMVREWNNNKIVMYLESYDNLGKICKILKLALEENNFIYTVNNKGGFYVKLKLSDLGNYEKIVREHLKKEFWCEITGTKTIFIYGDGEVIEVINKQDSIKALKKCKEFYKPMNAHYNLWEMLWNCEFYHDVLCFTDDGININSDFLDGLETKKAKEKITRWLEEKGVGKKAVNYKLRDWVFSRQHYWGEPIPLIFCPTCKKRVENYKSKIANLKQIQNSKFKIQNFEFNLGEILNPGWIAVPEEELPVELPCLEKYQPTGTGESPLANVKEWVNCKCPKCGGVARRETDTMPNWAGSSWYFMRYIDPENDKFLADKKKLKYWMPIDWYNGGMEHTTLHLLYSRFWYKFLFDIGIVSQDEPYQKRTSHGIVLAEDGRKMSKSFGNVINPDDIIREYGADSLRLYEMFMGPFEQTISWNMQGVVGMRRFLEKVWTLRSKVNSEAVVGSEAEQSRSNTLNNLNNGNRLERLVCQTIKKVTEDIDNFKFNTAISALMILANEFEKENQVSSIQYQVFLKLLSPFAPHICEEIYQSLKLRIPITDDQPYLKSQIPNHHEEFKSIFQERWPKYNPKLVKEEKNTLIIQINGKLRDKIEVEANISEEEVKELVLSREKVVRWTKGKKIRKIVFVSGKLINIVC